MNQLPTLDGPRLQPATGGPPEQLAILLHGVGADGNDLIGLAPFFQRTLPGALIVSPHAPFAFDMAPTGFQWFSLQDFAPETRLAGARAAAPILDAFIDAQLAEHGLAEDKLVLIGFSQGAIMSLHVGPRRARPLAGILGFSGMLAGPHLLAGEIVTRPPVLLTHGDADPILPVHSLPEAVAGLKAAGIAVQSHLRPGLGHGIDDECVRLGQDFLARIFAPAGG